MRWRIPVVFILALFVAVSCDQQPAEPSSAAAVVQSAPTFAAGGLGATVVRGDIGCALIDGDGDYYPPFFDGNCGTEVATYSRNGNAVFIMRMSGVPNSTGRTVHYDPYNPGWRVVQDNPDLAPGPYPCYLLGPERDFNNFLMTTQWHSVVTASGEATFTCIYSTKWAY
ncbi:MAG TPA: hypothetical protein VK845_07925 [Gemmatimonadales bacterium]|nr:hypothetical protein [Gemmatimonadales bacterium]